MMIKGIPDCITRAVMFIKAFRLKLSQKLIQNIMYLYREFYIKTDITPIVKEYKIRLTYKDKNIVMLKLNDLNDLVKVIEKIKEQRAIQIKELQDDNKKE